MQEQREIVDKFFVSTQDWVRSFNENGF